MDIKTRKLTQGALITAVFGVLVYLNRQTAGMFQGLMVYFYALPITIYIAWYGMKAGGAVVVAMTLLSFLLGTPTYAFYSCLCLLIGIVFGECLYKRVSPEKTIFWVLFIAIVVNIIDLISMAFISGISLESEASEMSKMMMDAFDQAGANVDEKSLKMLKESFSMDLLKKILIVSKVLAGAFQGFITYELGLLIMRKLRIKVQKPKSLNELRPPKWTGYAAVVGYFGFNIYSQQIVDNIGLKNNLMMVSVVFYLFLIIFGIFGGIILLKKYMPGRKVLPVVLSLVGVLILPLFILGLGFLNITGLGGLFEDNSESGLY